MFFVFVNIGFSSSQTKIVISWTNFHHFLKSQWVLNSIFNELQDFHLTFTKWLTFVREMEAFGTQVGWSVIASAPVYTVDTSERRPIVYGQYVCITHPDLEKMILYFLWTVATSFCLICIYHCYQVISISVYHLQILLFY